MIRMHLRETGFNRVELATLAVCETSTVALAMDRWRNTSALVGRGATEVCASAEEMISADSTHLMAACRLRDAGFGVAAAGVCRPGHLALLRRWPLTAVMFQTGMLGWAETPDGAAWMRAWTDAARQCDVAVVAHGMQPVQVRLLHELGCTHGTWLNDPAAVHCTV